MSLLRTIKKNITKNRAKTPNRPMQSAFKLEALEPRLLLSASLTDGQVNQIQDNLSHFTLPAIPGMSLKDVIETKAAMKDQEVKAFLENSSNIILNKLIIDLSAIQAATSINGLGPIPRQ